jgi:hypothetical protein
MESRQGFAIIPAGGQRLPHFLDCSGNISQAAVAGGIFDFAGAEASLNFTLDPVRDLRLPEALQVLSNVSPRVLEAIAKWDRVFVLLYADPDLELGFAEHYLLGEIYGLAI